MHKFQVLDSAKEGREERREERREGEVRKRGKKRGRGEEGRENGERKEGVGRGGNIKDATQSYVHFGIKIQYFTLITHTTYLKSLDFENALKQSSLDLIR